MSHQLWTTSLKWNLSPNLTYFLDCCKYNIMPSKTLINPDAERLIAEQKGLINAEGKLTEKAFTILDELETYIVKTKKKIGRAHV